MTAPDLCFRPLRPADAEPLIDLVLAARAVDGPAEPVTRDEIRHQWFDHPGVDRETDTLVAALPDGRLAGAMAIFTRDAPVSVARVFVPGVVHPAHRRRGIGTRLLRHGEARARALVADVPAGVPRQVDCESPAGAPDRIALFEREGFRRARSFVTMRRDLTVPIPAPALPSSLAFSPWTPALDDATRLAHNDAFRDHWGSDPLSADRWRHFVATVPGFRPDCSWLAIDAAHPEERVAGYTLATVNGDPRGDRVGWLGTIGVRRTWRHQGVASALIARSLASFADAGASHAGLDVDADNPSGAVRVYEALGFQRTEASIIFSKPIEP